MKNILFYAVVCSIAVSIIVNAVSRTKINAQKRKQLKEYVECVEKNTVNPGSYICVPPKFMMED